MFSSELKRLFSPFFLHWRPEESPLSWFYGRQQECISTTFAFKFFKKSLARTGFYKVKRSKGFFSISPNFYPL